LGKDGWDARRVGKKPGAPQPVVLVVVLVLDWGGRLCYSLSIGNHPTV
jgi:hypothetical protein